MSNPEEILDYWLGEVGQERWYGGGEELDAEIRDRFEPIWEAAAGGGLDHWVSGPGPALAFIVVTDQFPRNMFRGEGRAFSTDAMARTASERSLDAGWDLKAPEPDRQFFYLPLMHSEEIADQDRCVALMAERMAETGESNLLHARAHREVIRRYGRFPYRNDALGRENTAEEAEFLENSGYAAILKELGG